MQVQGICAATWTVVPQRNLLKVERGQLLGSAAATASLGEREPCGNESKKTEDSGTETLCNSGDFSFIQLDATQWLRYHGSIAAVLRSSHENVQSWLPQEEVLTAQHVRKCRRRRNKRHHSNIAGRKFKTCIREDGEEEVEDAGHHLDAAHRRLLRLFEIEDVQLKG